MMYVFMDVTSNIILHFYFDSLFHELQNKGGGFLGNGLYLLDSSAVVGVPTVSVHSC